MASKYHGKVVFVRHTVEGQTRYFRLPWYNLDGVQGLTLLAAGKDSDFVFIEKRLGYSPEVNACPGMKTASLVRRPTVRTGSGLFDWRYADEQLVCPQCGVRLISVFSDRFGHPKNMTPREIKKILEGKGVDIITPVEEW